MPSASGRLSNVVVSLGAAVVGGALLAGAFGWGGGLAFWSVQALYAALGAALIAAGLLCTAKRRAPIVAAWQRGVPVSPGLGVVLCLSFGLLLGLAEPVHTYCWFAWQGKVLNQSVDRFWCVPTIYAAVFGVAGVGVALVVRAWPRAVPLPVLVFALGLVGSWSQLLVHYRLDGGAALVLAIAVATCLVRLRCVRQGSLLLWARRALPVLVGVLASILVHAFVAVPWLEQRALAALPAPAPHAPNVLLVVLDTVRADHLRSYGYDRTTTPVIDRLADRGIRFQWPIATAPWTLPTHAALFSGQLHHEVDLTFEGGVAGMRATLAGFFGRHGYATAGFVGNIGYCSEPWGIAAGFGHYFDFPRSVSIALLSAELSSYAIKLSQGSTFVSDLRNRAETVSAKFIAWLPQRGERPFFAFLNYFDAHERYEPSPGYDTLFGASASEIRGGKNASGGWTDAQLQPLRNAYDGCIRYIDDQFERVLDHLDRIGELQDTVVVVTSDHGEQFGEHNLLGHANSLYREVLHVPLFVCAPGRVPASVVVDDFVSLRDVPATICELAGYRDHPFPGRSLSRFWDPAESPAVAEPILSQVTKTVRRSRLEPASHGFMNAVLVDGLHYILRGDAIAEVYDWRGDPAQLRNLIDAPSAAAVVARARAHLAAVLPPGPWRTGLTEGM